MHFDVMRCSQEAHMTSRYDSLRSDTFDIDELFANAVAHNFTIDVRGAYPIMIKGQHSAFYTCRQDLLNFINQPATPSPVRYQ
jgi:hypothetical protein